MTTHLSAVSPSVLLARIAPGAGTTQKLPIGVFDLFKVGIGPSSSHTVGPMNAAAAFVRELTRKSATDVARIEVTTFGSLAWTGKGHGTDKAIVLGLLGETPDRIDPDEAGRRFDHTCKEQSIELVNGRKLGFDLARDIIFDTKRRFDRHPNAMEFRALDQNDDLIVSETWFSVGGGFIEKLGDNEQDQDIEPPTGFAFRSAQELLDLCQVHGCSIADVAMANEIARRGEAQTVEEIDRVIDVMMRCIDRGLAQSGELPGGLRVRRRASVLFERLQKRSGRNSGFTSRPFDHISAFAIAVNEENAAGGRVVTAPTNGAAGVVPAVLRYYRDFCEGASREGMRTFLLVASAIGSIIKRNASISGAEVGCQGEVGSAAAMASAGVTAALGGSNEQVENAAEIAIEHHLGMTCDPVGGLVQIPCIERNAFGAIKAVNAAYLALAGDGKHRVSLDQVIETMRQTGADMHDKYRETSRGGLAVNVPEC